MKTFFLFISLFMCASTAVAQQAMFGRLLERYYPTMSEQDEATVWAFFNDKGEEVQHKLSLPPERFLSQRAIQRRQQAMRSSRIIQVEDLPVERAYINRVADIVKQVRHEVKWFNTISVVATKAQIDRLRNDPAIREIELVGRFRRSHPEIEMTPSGPPPPPGHVNTNPILNYGNSLTQNDQINTVAVHNLGITGEGVMIGIFDAGFSNLTHPALVTRPIIARYDFVNNSPTLGSNSHGQNTFSVVGGFSEGNLIGPAFGSSFVLARTEDVATEKPIEEDNWARAIIWADSIGIDVASTSLGYTTYDSPWPSYTWQDMDGQTTIITRAADRASDLGIVIVNSAGNDGLVSLPANSLGAPSDGFNVLAAGAVSSSGNRSSFSSVGPSADGRIKPDIMAMGSSVWAASGTSSYTGVSGTSFSCPLSAGVAALIVSANPGLTPRQVGEAMRLTASRASNPDRLYGWGILNTLKAINYIWIDHAPLTDTEDTTSRTVVVTIRSRVPLVQDSTRVEYGVGGIYTGSSLLVPTINPNEYSAQIPFLGNGTNVTYYIRVMSDSTSNRLPLNAPQGGSFSYQVGEDLTSPAITHTHLGNQSIESWPPRIEATVTDISDVDSVVVEYALNGVPRTSIVLSAVDSIYSDTLHIGKSEIAAGDSISYRIIATDRSRARNVAIYPASGEISFAVKNFVNMNISFEQNFGDLTATNDWQWGVPAGSSPTPHSGTKYWGTVLTGNYAQGPRLSSLTTPTYAVFSDRPSFTFYHWQEIQSRFDGGNLKASINGGPFQLIRPVGDYQIQEVYNSLGNPLGGQPAFSDVAGTAWKKETFDLTGTATEGNTIAIRFDFGADNSVQYRGWYIDDFISEGFGEQILVGTKHPEELPNEFALEQNYPNPFNPKTRIQFSVPNNGTRSRPPRADGRIPSLELVTLKVFDLLGREVATLVNEMKQPGVYTVQWDARAMSAGRQEVASGLYVYQLRAGSFVSTRKMLLLK